MDEPFRALTEGSLTGFYLICDGRFAYANAALATMFGYRPEELIGRMRAIDLTYPDDRPMVAESIRQRLAGQTGVTRYQVRGLHKDGSQIPVEVHSRFIIYDGKPAVMGTIVDYGDQLRLQNEMRESEARLEKAQRLAHVGWWEHDVASNRMTHSAELARILGVPEIEPGDPREGWIGAVHPEDRRRVDAINQAAVRGEASRDCEYRILRPDGTVRIVNSHLDVTRDADGRPLRVFGVLQDITELRQAERDLRASEERFRTFVDHATDGFYLLDASGATLDVNREACESSGYLREELIGKPMIDFFASEEPSTRMRRRARVAAGRIATFESRHIRKDGTSFPVELRVRPFEQRGSKFLASVRDISERKCAEQRAFAHQAVTRILAESATLEEAVPQLLQAICEHLGWDVGILWRFDRDADGLRGASIWHDAACPTPHLEALLETRTFPRGSGLPGRIWATRTAEVMPNFPIGAAGPGAEAAQRDGMHAVLASPVLLGSEVLGVITFFSRSVQHPDQHVLEVMGIIGSQIGQFMERKRAEHGLQLIQAEIEHLTRVMTLSALTSSIAHEIKEPIAAAVANAGAARRWLASESPNLDEALGALNRIVEDGMRAGGVLDRIRALIKRMPTHKGAVDINEAIREIVDLTRSEAIKHGVSVHTDLPADLPPVFGDRVQLQQVVLNLTINAFEAMDANDGPRELLISSTLDAPDVMIEVRDSGPGFAPDIWEHLFELFNTTKKGGLGLGLSICRSIVETHGGRLWASAREPRGVSFRFTIPRFVPGPAGGPASDPEATGSRAALEYVDRPRR